MKRTGILPIRVKAGAAMQRWIKLPDGRFIDANRAAIIGKPEAFSRFDEDGNDMGIGYSLQVGTNFTRDCQITVIGTRDEVLAVLRNLLVESPGSATVDATAAEAAVTTG